MVRQFWLYLLPEEIDGFVASLEAIEGGVTIAGGKYLRGEPSLLLEPSRVKGLQFPQLSRREQRRIVFHAAHSKVVTTHPVVEGPQAIADALAIDETRSDCLVLTVPSVSGGTLGPARLMAETHYFEHNDKVRKTPSFITWTGRVMRALRAKYPRTAVEFIHAAPGALEWAQSGKGSFHYLHEPVGPVPVGERTKQFAPQHK